MRYEAIQRHRDQYPIRLMCRCLKVSPSGFHDWARRLPGQGHRLVDVYHAGSARIHYFKSIQ